VAFELEIPDDILTYRFALDTPGQARDYASAPRRAAMLYDDEPTPRLRWPLGLAVAGACLLISLCGLGAIGLVAHLGKEPAPRAGKAGVPQPQADMRPVRDKPIKRAELSALVMNQPPERVLSLIGRPDNTRKERPPPMGPPLNRIPGVPIVEAERPDNEVWTYRQLTLDSISNKVDAETRLYFHADNSPRVFQVEHTP
jgi:hypothetical protein